MKQAQLRKLRWIFLLLFGVTGLILGVLLVRLGDPKYTGWILVPGQTPAPAPPLPSTERIALIISLISTLITAAGFISTTALAWRKELREGEQSLLERERRLLELEKLRREVGAPTPGAPQSADERSAREPQDEGR